MVGKRPYGPEVEEAFLQVINPPNAWWDAPPEGFGGKPTPPLIYPRLVRKHAGRWSRDPSFPLYRQVWRLAKAAEKGPDDPRFRKAVLKAAHAIGILDPHGEDGYAPDSLVGWHKFALEVREYLLGFKEVSGYLQERWGVWGRDPSEWLLGLQEYLSSIYANPEKFKALGFRWDHELGGYKYTGPVQNREGAEAAFAVVNILGRAVWEAGDGEGWDAPLRGVGRYLMSTVVPAITRNMSLRGDGTEALSFVSARAWALLEISRLFLSRREVRFCPNPHCGVAFIPTRSDQRTCGSERCKKWAARNLGIIRRRSK